MFLRFPGLDALGLGAGFVASAAAPWLIPHVGIAAAVFWLGVPLFAILGLHNIESNTTK